VTGPAAPCGLEQGRNTVADAADDGRSPLDVTATDCRGSRRVDHRDADRIAWLREQSRIDDPVAPEEDETPAAQRTGPRLEAARGVVIGLLVGAAMWAAIIFALRHFL
jgi:hypothetical protein